MGKNEILNRWSGYIEVLYNDERCPAPPISNGIEGSPILAEEVEHALKKMKKGKAAGPDNVPIELITALQDIGVMEVTKLLNIICYTGEIPHDLAKSVFIVIPKKPGTTDCEQHRTISPISQQAKVLLRVLLCRMRSKIRPEISEKQFGFVADRGTRNAIFKLNMLLERSIVLQITQRPTTK